MRTSKILGLSALAGAALMAAVTFSAAPALAQGAPAPAAALKTPAPKILVVDRNAILRGSKVGADIGRQVRELTQAAEKDLKAESESLKRDGEALQQQIAILSADAKRSKIEAFQRRQEAFRAKVQERQDLIQGGVIKARQQVEVALQPILQGIMAERGANLMMDRNAIILGTVDVDVTGAVIDRLNKKLPALKVDLVKPPAGLVQQQQQQQQQQ